MVKLFQLLLLTVICIYVLMLSVLIIGHIIMWDADNPGAGELNSTPSWVYTTRVGPIKLRKNYHREPTTGTGTMTHYIIVPGASADSLENGQLYVLNKHNEKVFVEQDSAGDRIVLPISASAYSSFKIISLILLGIALAIIIWVTVLLYRFTRSALQKNFFTVSNMRKLQLVGWIITSYGIISWLCAIAVPLLIRITLHYKNISGLTPSGFSVFPSWLITGMLLLLIAKAFENGINLKEEHSLIV